VFDGGSPITGYVIEKKELDRDVWVACGKLSGKAITAMKFLEYDINDLLPYFVYMFRTAAVNAQGEGEFLQSVMPTVAKHAVDPPIQPDTPRIVDYDKNWVKLEWWAPSNSDIKHYIVEKRETFMVPKDFEGEAPAQEESVTAEGEEEQLAQDQQSAAVKAVLSGGAVAPEPELLLQNLLEP
jgi:titin